MSKFIVSTSSDAELELVRFLSKHSFAYEVEAQAVVEETEEAPKKRAKKD